MDPSHFDSWTKILVAPGSRRDTLRLLAAALLGGRLPAFETTQAALRCKGKGEACSPKKADECCSRRCRGRQCLCSELTQDCNERSDCCDRDLLCEKVRIGVRKHCCRDLGRICFPDREEACCSGTCDKKRHECCLPGGERCKDNPGACCGEMICHKDPFNEKNPRQKQCCLNVKSRCDFGDFRQRCCGGLCKNGRCCFVNGHDCNDPSQCCSGFCHPDEKTCQRPLCPSGGTRVDGADAPECCADEDCGGRTCCKGRCCNAGQECQAGVCCSGLQKGCLHNDDCCSGFCVYCPPSGPHCVAEDPGPCPCGPPC